MATKLQERDCVRRRWDRDRNKPGEHEHHTNCGWAEATHLMNDRVEHFPSEQNTRDSEVAVYQAHGRIMWVLGVEAREVEHLVCKMPVRDCSVTGPLLPRWVAAERRVLISWSLCALAHLGAMSWCSEAKVARGHRSLVAAGSGTETYFDGPSMVDSRGSSGSR